VADNSIERGLGERIARAASSARTTVPVDLEQMARNLGVVEISYSEMVEDGRTTWENHKPRIELRADRPPDRMRFTLAHEIGHILIDRDQGVAHRTRGLQHDEVETLCDWIAASILMPREWILPYARRDRYTLSLLRLVAHRAGVSLSAAAVRIAEVGGRTCVLLRWQRAPQRWVVVGQAAVPTRFLGTLEATPATCNTLDALPARRDTWRELTLTAGATNLAGHAHVDRSGKTCLTLFTSLEHEV
jgi:Zn-dependent peptidase ImmA (M78 family)